MANTFKPMLTQFGNFTNVMNHVAKLGVVEQLKAIHASTEGGVAKPSQLKDQVYSTVAGVEVERRALKPNLQFEDAQQLKNSLTKRLEQYLGRSLEPKEREELKMTSPKALLTMVQNAELEYRRKLDAKLNPAPAPRLIPPGASNR